MANLEIGKMKIKVESLGMSAIPGRFAGQG
jgi:hypothetical protein